MSILTLILTLLLLPIILVRLARWLAWTQQKEYRVDRLWHFLTSEEGLQELLRLTPRQSDFTRTGLKRPVITLRSLAVGFLSLVLLSFSLTAGYFNSWWWLPVAIYVLVPLYPGVISLTTEVLKTILSLVLLFLAKQKLVGSKPRIIGITGSYGKTTTRHLVAHTLSSQFTIFTPPKSHNTPLSIAWSILKNYKGEELVFLEFAAYKKGEIKHLAWWFPPELSIVTGVTEQHLALFGSLDNIIKAKGELVRATKLDGIVFYNGNDPGARAICDIDPSKKIQAYAGPESKVLLANTRLDNKGRLSFTWQGHELQTLLVGLHYLETVQAAISVALHFGISEQKIRTSLRNFLPTDNFIQVYQHPTQFFMIINDGNTSNPRGFQAGLAVLEYFKKQGKNTLLITSGIIDLGEQSDAIHLKLAKAAEPIADLVLYTGIDGREIFKERFDGKMTHSPTTMQTVMDKLNAQDVVLVEGNIPVWLMKQLMRKP
jgi:UDP-N-acetylmuramoyl-tripeptide--D-alanyl-D-alanine ligase